MHHILGTFPKYNTRIQYQNTIPEYNTKIQYQNGRNGYPNIQIHDRSLSWLRKNKTTESTYFTLQHLNVSLLNFNT
jgi:hypothetical protein